MMRQEKIPDVSRFDAVDQTGDPAAMVAFLEAAGAIPGLRDLKSAMLGQLRLGQADAALDVGCGFGADVAEMARRMPPGGAATGIDRSATMIAEARQRTAGLGLKVAFDVGDAMELPYADASLGACRSVTVLQHLTSPQRAIQEMARVTRPGGRVAALEFDLGTAMIDHPDRATTRLILGSSEDEAVQGWMGRQLPRLFGQAGLTDVSVTASAILSDLTIAQMLFRRPAERLCQQGILTSGQVGQWWSQLSRRAAGSQLVVGATAFLVAAAKP
jgi:SAM-dependent methyltransferase